MPNRWLDLLQRLRAPRPAVEAGPPAPATLTPERFIAVIVDGFAEGEIDGILDSVERSSRAGGMRPVVLTRQPELGPYRRRGVPVELLVDPGRQAARDKRLPWQLRRRAQLCGFVRLWQPAAVVSFARPPDAALLAELRAELTAASR